MNDKTSKLSISSVVTLEMIEFSKKTEAKQTEIRALFNDFIQQAVIDIPQDNRLILDTDSGATIACNGPLEDALEDALFISINIRDEILKHNAHSETPLYVQFGIHLGDARKVKKTMVGEGVKEAKHIMSFAQANQILVSNVYFEMASKLTQEMAQLFEKYDMHAHEHDIYAVRLLKEAVIEAAPTVPTDVADVVVGQTIASKINWNYIGLVFLGLVAFFVLSKLVTSPTEPTITMEEPALVEKTTEKPTEIAPAKPAEKVAADEPKKAKPKEAKPKEAKLAQKKTEKKATQKSTEKPVENATAKTETPVKKVEKSAETKAEKPATDDKSAWESVKDSVTSGGERNCSQAEIAMNQCNR